jgi:hypothetical protein
VTHTERPERKLGGAAGRLLEAVGDDRPRQMTILSRESAREQNSAYGSTRSALRAHLGGQCFPPLHASRIG